MKAFKGENSCDELFFQSFLIFVLFVMCVLIKFTWYHLKLIFENKTTIGNLSHGNFPYKSEFDFGFKYNIQ